jgi:hypothetical protein
MQIKSQIAANYCCRSPKFLHPGGIRTEDLQANAMPLSHVARAIKMIVSTEFDAQYLDCKIPGSINMYVGTQVIRVSVWLLLSAIKVFITFLRKIKATK